MSQPIMTPDRNIVEAGAGNSRRDFLKVSASVATAAAVAAAFPAGVHASNDETIKIALIGCGGRGTGACNQALNTYPQGPVKLIAMADAFEDRLQGALRSLKIEHPDAIDVPGDRQFVGFDAYKKAIDAGPDLVVIATPPGFRPIHFEYAVKQGKNIFAEKPIATDAPGVRRFLAAAEEAKKKNLKVGIGLQRHHQPLYLQTIEQIQNGVLGDLILLRAYWNDAGVWVKPRSALKANKPDLTEMEYQMRNWYYFTWLCGDHIVEQHIHNLDVANWVMQGHPVSAQGQGGRQVLTGLDNGEIFDHHFVEFTYADGTKLLSQCRHQPNTWKSVSEHAHGSNGYADISRGLITFKHGKTWKYQGPTRGGGGGGGKKGKGKNAAPPADGKPPRNEQDPYQIEHDDLFHAVRNNIPYSEAEYGAHSTMTAILGRMCTYSGQEIKWDDAINSELSIMPKEYAWDANPPHMPDKDGRYPVAIPGVTKVL